MVNNNTSGCEQCMKLLRLLTLNNMRFDRRVFAKHVKGKDNKLSDALSHLQFNRFFQLAPKSVDQYPHNLPDELWPITKIWNAKTVC